MLPRVKIQYLNGQIGAYSASDDGTVGLMTTGVAVSGKFALGTAYLITKLSDLAALGITSEANDANANIYKFCYEFYSEAPEGSRLWIQAAADTVTMTTMADKTSTHAKNLIESAGGTINLLVVMRKPPVGYTPTVTGVDTDVLTAMVKANELGVWAADTKFAPIFTILEGRAYGGTASGLTDISQNTYNRVGIMIGDTVTGSSNAACGLLAGRIAAIPVQRSIARVRSGAISATAFYIGAKVPENADPDIISDKGYITFRNFVGKSGYFFTDDKLATAATDDYALIPRRRVIDKAYRIAYQTLIEELGEEIPINNDGTIPAAIAKSWQNAVEVAIQNQMTTPGNLGVDPADANDTGVTCYIDTNQNVAASNTIEVTVQVKPYGYAKYINVSLGFQVA